jgi:hypothetical protein
MKIYLPAQVPLKCSFGVGRRLAEYLIDFLRECGKTQNFEELLDTLETLETPMGA